jgi:hypothetical protein
MPIILTGVLASEYLLSSTFLKFLNFLAHMQYLITFNNHLGDYPVRNCLCNSRTISVLRKKNLL